MLDSFPKTIPRHILQELSWSVLQRLLVWEVIQGLGFLNLSARVLEWSYLGLVQQLRHLYFVWEGLKSLLQQNWLKEWGLELSCALVLVWLGFLNLLSARFLESQLYFPPDHCHILPLEFSFVAFFVSILWNVYSQVPTRCDNATWRTCDLAKGGQPFLRNTVRHKCYRCWRNRLWNLIFLCF